MKLTKILPISVLLSTSLVAQDVRSSWNGNAGDGDFSNPNNWFSFDGSGPNTPGYAAGSPSNAIIQGGSTTTPATISTNFIPAFDYTPLIVRGGQTLNIQADVTTRADNSIGGSFLAGQTNENNTINHSAGSVNIDVIQIGNTAEAENTSFYNFSGGVIAGSTVTLNSSGLLSINSSSTLTQSVFMPNVTAGISGSGNVAITGAGVVVMDDVNTYTGTTYVDAGTLALDGLGSIDASEEIAIASGAVFSVAATSDKTYGGMVTGEGTVAGSFTAETSSGAIRPGVGGDATIGTLTFQDSLIVTSGATLSLELAAALGTATPVAGQAHPDLTTVDTGLDAGTNHDSIEGGVLDFSAADAGSIAITLEGYTAAEGDYFDLFDFTSATGLTASLLDLPTLSGDLTWNTSLFTTEGVIAIVPEPTSSALLGLGTLGLLVRRKRQS